MRRAGVILQAQMASKRLPGKVLARLGTRTVLECCVLRLAAGGWPIVVATTELQEDDAIEQEARGLGVAVFRGDAQDVLSRYIRAAYAHDLVDIVRATADKPFVDGDGVARVLRHLERLRADHVIERGLPVGAAVEAVKLEALMRSHVWITRPEDREHVTSFVRRDPRFRACSPPVDRDRRHPELRLTVDTPMDLDFCRALATRLDRDMPVPPFAAIVREAEALARRLAS
jgi:spore coat polysaccharide biosynthesis protein SpsF (cytidylyltransferase family)